MEANKIATEHIIRFGLAFELDYIEKRLKSRSKDCLASRDGDRFKRYVVKRFIRELGEKENDRQSMDYLMQQLEEGRIEYHETRDIELCYRALLAHRLIREMVDFI